jgi:hypothetical protein
LRNFLALVLFTHPAQLECWLRAADDYRDAQDGFAYLQAFVGYNRKISDVGSVSLLVALMASIALRLARVSLAM